MSLQRSSVSSPNRIAHHDANRIINWYWSGIAAVSFSSCDRLAGLIWWTRSGAACAADHARIHGDPAVAGGGGQNGSQQPVDVGPHGRGVLAVLGVPGADVIGVSDASGRRPSFGTM